MTSKPVSAFYYDKDGAKVTLSCEELHIPLANGQVLTVSPSLHSDGIVVSDHSLQESDLVDNQEFALLTITPSAANLVIIDSHKRTQKQKK